MIDDGYTAQREVRKSTLKCIEGYAEEKEDYRETDDVTTF